MVPVSSSTLTPGVPSPSKTSKDKAQWAAEDVAYAVFRLSAFGATEDGARTLLGYMELTGVRNPRRYLAAVPDDDLAKQVHRAEVAAVAAEARRRGDLIRVRSKVQWPWRTSTGVAGR